MHRLDISMEHSGLADLWKILTHLDISDIELHLNRFRVLSNRVGMLRPRMETSKQFFSTCRIGTAFALTPEKFPFL